MPRIQYERTVDAPPSIVWNVITDHELYAEAAPNLSSVDVVDGTAETMVRRCVDTDGNVWTEACTGWEPGKRFSVRVDVAESDFHRRLFSRFEGEWGLEENDVGVKIEIAFDFEPRYGPLGVVISKYLTLKAPGLINAIFDRWEDEIEARRGVVDTEEERVTNETTGQRTNALYP